jgi:hypothetical protein
MGAMTLPERPLLVTYGGLLGELALWTIAALAFVGSIVWLLGPLIAPAILFVSSVLTRLIGVWRDKWTKISRGLFTALVLILVATRVDPQLADTLEAAFQPLLRLGLVGVRAGIFLLAFVLAWIGWIQVKELADRPDPTLPSWDSAREERLRRLENRRPQNHMVGLTPIKPGPVRKLTLRVVLWLIDASKYVRKTSMLSGVTTIHFARWVIIDKGRQLVFLSHYDGDWDAYLGDFITQASRGLTAVWSNCVGFPRSWFLFFGGARDERTFKAYARKHQHETLFVYSAYPTLTVADIDNHTAIREAFGRSLDTAGLDGFLRRL